MKFNTLFSNQYQLPSEMTHNGYNYLQSIVDGHCLCCDSKTPWINIQLEVFLCGTECLEHYEKELLNEKQSN